MQVNLEAVLKEILNEAEHYFTATEIHGEAENKLATYILDVGGNALLAYRRENAISESAT